MMFRFENPRFADRWIQATGNYPGKARNASELRADLEQAMRLIPGPKRLNLHAIYLESDARRARPDQTRALQNWVEWAKTNQLGLDLTLLFFASAKRRWLYAFHADDSIRQFWIDHCRPAAVFQPILASNSAHRR